MESHGPLVQGAIKVAVGTHLSEGLEATAPLQLVYS